MRRRRKRYELVLVRVRVLVRTIRWGAICIYLRPSVVYLRSMNELEEGRALRLDFGKLLRATAAAPDIVPVAVQNIDTGEVILVAFANPQALRAAIERRSAVFWSTSRNELWEKGKTSGETFDLI